MSEQKLKARIAALEKALLEIAEWNSISPATRADIGSWGERDYYKGVALKALYPNPIKANEE